MQVIVVDDEGAPDVPAGGDGEGEGDTVDSFASKNADEKDSLFGHDLGTEDNTTLFGVVASVLQRPSVTLYLHVVRVCPTRTHLYHRSALPLPPRQPSLHPSPMSNFIAVQSAGSRARQSPAPLPPPSPHLTLMPRKSPSTQPQGREAAPYSTAVRSWPNICGT